MPVANVAASAAATSSWANSVADSVNGLEDDLYPSSYGVLEVPWASITGLPSTFPPTLANPTSQAIYGGSPANGVSTSGARADHLHGTPALPTAAQVGTVAAYDTPLSGAGGKRLYVGTSTPTTPSEGDVWIKG